MRAQLHLYLPIAPGLCTGVPLHSLLLSEKRKPTSSLLHSVCVCVCVCVCGWVGV